MKIKIDPGAFMPERAHKTDAGLDLKAMEAVSIWPGQSGEINTGVHIEFPENTYGKIESKSGLNFRNSIVACGGIIDEGYRGAIVVKLYNFGDRVYRFKPGDKVAQLIIQPYLAPELEVVEALEDTERGEAGFGSTGT